MANIINQQKLIDSTKRSLIKYCVQTDGTVANNSNVTLLDASLLNFALNANGYIMSSNTHPRSRYRLSIKRVFGSCHSNGFFRLRWASDSNTDILIIPDGSFDYNFENMGDGAVIPQPTTEANVTGDILYSMHGLDNGDAMTLFIDLKKDNNDYDAGQTADPYAFNRKGPF
jgi:hypothetical protein